MSRALPLAEALARAETLVDDRYGIIRQTVVHEIGPSDPAMFFATAELASTLPFSDARANVFNGGAGIDAPSATMRALGEAIERYGLGIYREAELIRGSFDDLAGRAVDPRRLIFFAEDQYTWPGFPFARFDPSQPLSWVSGTSLLDGRPRLVPAARVFTPYRAPHASERILQSISTGAACHGDRDQAVLSGLYECIERDAVTISWLNRLALPAIDPTKLAADAEDLRVRLARRGLTFRLFDATTDVGIPTAFCVLYGPPETIPSVAVGAATHASMSEAASKALIESAHTFYWIHTRSRGGLPRFRDDYADVTSLDAHSLLYGHPSMREKLAFLTGDVPDAVQVCKAALRREESPEVKRRPAKDLARCTSALRRLGLEAVVVDLTPSDVEELGFVVVRVVVTDLHPLWGGHAVRCLGGRRLHDVPVRLGYRASDTPTSDFNLDPHPMP